jgi:Domain of unknown function (DUF4253)
MARPRATLTLQESADGEEVYVLVQTREPLGPYRALDRQWEPEQFLSQEVNPGSVQLICSLEVESGLWLPQLRASTPFWGVDRYLDITAQGEERRLLERMIGQEDFEVVWANERVRARRPIDERTREVLEETFAGFPGLDSATWKEAVAESEWGDSPNWRPGPRPRKPKRRTARPRADVELRYFATRTGALPREGAARVAHVRLPRGSRFGGFWCSDEAVGEPIPLASALADEFSGTGLWPLLWAFPEEPTGYMSGLGDLEWIDVEATTLLEREWAAHPPRPEWAEALGTTFPGLAPPIGRYVGRHFDPFETLKAHRLGTREPLSARLLVVPCNRPADALTAVGFGGVELRSEDLSAILRSWEERFGAVVTLLGPGRTVLSVEAPPRTFPSALAVAAEHFAVAPAEDAGRPGALAEHARLLQGAPIWDLGWRG